MLCISRPKQQLQTKGRTTYRFPFVPHFIQITYSELRGLEEAQVDRKRDQVSRTVRQYEKSLALEVLLEHWSDL